MKRARYGLTLIELLIVIAIIAIIISLVTPAVLYARNLSIQLKSKNNLFSLCLASQQRADMHRGQLPTCIHDTSDRETLATVHYSLLLYLDGGKVYSEHLFDPDSYPPGYSFPVFVSPADFTLSGIGHARVCSYPANAQVFGRKANLNRSFSDGTSRTVLFSEHYAHCNNVIFHYNSNQYVPEGVSFRRSTFADGGIPGFPTYGDVYPVPFSSPQGTVPSVPGKTFQVRPSVADCDPTIPQTPHSALLCGFADGSVRTVGQGVSENVFWSAITMNGGETVSLD
jgi:prepilin-type N-terminal cleavage/methylation domain-containing protein